MPYGKFCNRHDIATTNDLCCYTIDIMYAEADQIKQLIADSRRIVIIQADNPDGDSLASALALEQILSDMGKEPYLYCGVNIPPYLTYLLGWDRVSIDMPKDFDLSIIVDTSASALLENLLTSTGQQYLASKPCIVIDHHDVESSVPFATVVCNQPAVATGEVIYELAQNLGWPLADNAKQMITTAILSDSLGLTTEATSARSIHIIGELVEAGVSIADLENKRRQLMRKSPELTHYKGELLQRVEYFKDNRIAVVAITNSEIETYSPHYNPSMLVLEDMRMTTDTQVAIAFKVYKSGRVTAKIRCNQGASIANKLAQAFGGGGHAYAAGFKIQDGRPYNEIKSECISVASELLQNIPPESTNETVRYTIA